MTWNEIRARNPERMKAHLENLNRVHREGAAAREGRLRPLVGIMPSREMASWELRDELAQAWEDVYGEEITSKFAWLEVRFGIRRGLFRLTPSGKYATMGGHGEHNGGERTPEEGVDGLRDGTHG